MPAAKRIKRLKFECPCERHGGFRPNLKVLEKITLAHRKLVPL
jgi:hypothetical protein